jgi:hypothetical protein
VQEANITFPTHFKLILKAINLIFKLGAFLNIRFRLKYTEELKQLKSKINFSKSESDADKTLSAVDRARKISNSLLVTLEKNLPEWTLKTYLVKSLIYRLSKAINQEKDDKKNL